MRRRQLPRGLRTRLLLALLLTSLATLAVAATVLLSPLPNRLREQSAVNLRGAVTASREGVENAVTAEKPVIVFATLRKRRWTPLEKTSASRRSAR